MTKNNNYPPGFEEDETLRSSFVREIILQQIEDQAVESNVFQAKDSTIPRKLVRFWHDPFNLDDDVRACLDSWDKLADNGFAFYMFDDVSALEYISDTYGEQERLAFLRCDHPAMRCDYLRLCFILAEGGMYVDADDVLIGDGWRHIFKNSNLKLQPLGFDITRGGMMAAADIWRVDLPLAERVFYVNNDPIAAPPGNPIVQHALQRATKKLLQDENQHEIQATTGPGNLTAALVAHARKLQLDCRPPDFELLRDWDSIAEMRWNLTYRNDSRNWRKVYGC